MSTYKLQESSYRQYWWQLCWLVETLNRCNELRRLVAWATKKRLVKPRLFYQDMLNDQETRLLFYRANARWLYTVAYTIHRLTYAVFPPPRYYRRGAAGGYSFKKR